MKDSLNPTAWAEFISHLAEDSEQAGREYERLRNTCVKFFAWRGRPDPIHLANVTLDRVMRKYHEGVPISNLNGYVRGVAQHIYQESLHGPVETDELPEDLAQEEDDAEERETEARSMDCMRECLATLPADDRELIYEFFQGAGRVRARDREKIARERNLSRSGLGTLVHRIRKKLKECREECMRRGAPAASDLRRVTRG